MRLLTILSVAFVLQLQAVSAAERNLAELEQQALAVATQTVAPSVVQIRTIGGLDRVGKTLLSEGPTTGLVVSADGFIISSAFNFAGRPSSILVRLADGQQLSAELVGRDKNRMLVLLKVNAERPLPVPTPVALEEINVGQWAIALGRTFQTDDVDRSVGIVSAQRRMHGRVLQTDANVSVANYGGPLVDISGRVLGILVPMSPQGDGGTELAGAEYYDSGIGFAVPLVHVMDTLERWKQETELLPGRLGIGMAKGDEHVTPPKITSIWPNSPAEKAGWKPQDLITAVDDVSVSTQAQLKFQIKPRYADDTLRVTIDRGGETLETEITLVSELAPYRHAFMGLMADTAFEEEKAIGVDVKFLWPEGPAAEAGLQIGDRITKLDSVKITSRKSLKLALAAKHAGESTTVRVVRNEKNISLQLTLANVPDEILSTTDLSSFLNDEDNDDAQTVESEKLKVPEFDREATYLVPSSDNLRQPGILLWLGDGDAQSRQALIDEWAPSCRRNAMVLLIAPPEGDDGWKSDDLSYLQQLLRLAARNLNVDPSRIVVGGNGKAGQLAYALAFNAKSNLAGVISVDAPLPRTIKPPQTSPKNRLAVLTIESKESNFAPLIRRDVEKLRDQGYPTTWLPQPKTVDSPDGLAETSRATVERWLFGLDRL